MSRQFDDHDLHLPDGWWTMYEFETDGGTWKQIEGHPKHYINEYGDVIGPGRHGNSPRIMSTWPNQYGHRYLKLDNDKLSVHRLAAKAFIPNPNNYPEVRHLDDEPENNCIDNLAWGTQKDNVRDMLDHGREFHKPIYCEETKTVYRGGAEAERILNVKRSAISRCCTGVIEKAKGYHFRFARREEYAK